MSAPARGTLALGVTLAGGNASVATSAGVRDALEASLAAAGNVSASRVRVVGVTEAATGWGVDIAPRAARRLEGEAAVEGAPALPELLASGGLGVWRYLLTVDTGSQGGEAAVNASALLRAVNASLAPAGSGAPGGAWVGVLAAWASATGQSREAAAAGLVVDGLAQQLLPGEVEPPDPQQQQLPPAVAPLSSGAISGIAIGALIGVVVLVMLGMSMRRARAGSSGTAAKPPRRLSLVPAPAPGVQAPPAANDAAPATSALEEPPPVTAAPETAAPLLAAPEVAAAAPDLPPPSSVVEDSSPPV